jgi:hypothetical protein
MSRWIGLVSPRGCVEYNARFVLGHKAAEKLEHGKWYTNDELNALADGFTIYPPGEFIPLACFLGDSKDAVEKNIKKWRADFTS